ncbi:MAG: glycosyltransferase family 39 protein [Magnetococcales bacterium]|nr:glycosyltransferase family 39 protein [Magnetococcales bacterium]MBF0115720.1 glycosyltransferase family 39 protein [Magnetococcales bacterium]
MASQTSVQSVTSPTWSKLLLVFLAVLWFALLGYRDLNEPDEGRYAEIPREMVASGDWLTPRLNGFQYFEKPPLQYWATAIFYQLFGSSAATSRLWSALMGFVGILWVIHVGSRLFGSRTGWYAGFILTSMLLYAAMGHFNTLDMGLSVWLFLGIGALVLAQTQRESDPVACRNGMLFGWAALAGACMSKGLIGLILPGGALLLYSLWQRDWHLWRHLYLGRGLLLFLLLTFPWVWEVNQANPEFARFFFIHEHFARYTTSVHSRVGPWWYFIGVFILGCVPWTQRAVVALCKPGFSWRAGAGSFDPVRLLWVYILFVIFFFSISQSKLIPYILPVFPPLALLMGRHLTRQESAPEVGWETRILALLASLLLLGAMHVELFANDRRPLAMMEEAKPWLLAAGTGLALAVAASLWWRCRGERALAVVVVGNLFAFQCIAWGADVFSPSNSSRNAARAILALEERDLPVYCVDCYYQSLPFYLNRTIHMVQYRGELDFGIRQQPELWFANGDVFLQRWQQESQAVVVFNQEQRQKWQKLGMPMRLIYQDPRRAVALRR